MIKPEGTKTVKTKKSKYNSTIGLIFALAKDAKISNEQLHDYLPDWIGEKSLKGLPQEKLIKVANCLTAAKNKHKFKPGVIYGGATGKQIGLIRAKQGILKLTDEQLHGFIAHTTRGECTIDNLSRTHASAVIVGLGNYYNDKTK